MIEKPPLDPPDSDLDPPDAKLGREDHHWVFVSHTATDYPMVVNYLKPLVEKTYIQLFVLNRVMRGSPDVIQRYKRRILDQLSRCAWFLVVVSKASLKSEWVRFEVDWAAHHRDPKRVYVWLLDDSDPAVLHPWLKTTNVIGLDDLEAAVDKIWSIARDSPMF
jgi:hypothetical protein